MSKLQTRIETLLEVTKRWLSNDNHYLMEAAGRTADEGYFAAHDVKFALRAIKKSINQTALEEWAKRAGLSDENDANGQNVLCLHAGNLPLVGFQDTFSTLLSGARYTGKISRKDPYLLPTFLNEVKKTAVWTDMDVQWSHRLDDFEDMRHHAVIFAGSESSVPGVVKVIKNLNLSTEKTRYLIRTAHFSMTYLDRQDERTMKDLVEGIFRYGGKGCRSVAIVVSPFSLNSIRCELTDYTESFWLESPQHLAPSPKLKQQFAYNKAIERPQAWLDDFLLQEGGLELDQDFICYWVQGSESTAAELAKKYGDELQSIYITHPDIEITGYEDRTEFLSDAQQPPINWKPDGVDTLEWLMKG
ncbi:MAG TPA: acyl-CoA reductase [Balneolaceae bacterium]